MGLFGPSWSWEEIQRKDSIMNDLKKENDRVLNQQRKENDRLINELGKRSTYRSEHSLTPEDYAFMHEQQEKRLEIYEREKMAALASRSLSQIVNNFFADICMISIYTIILILTRKIFILFIMFFLPLIVIIAHEFKNYVTLIKGVFSIKSIRNAKCYKCILDEIKKIDLEKIRCIEISSSEVTVETVDNKKKYKFESYKFPELPYEKQPVFLGSLIYDLGLNKQLKISNRNNIILIAENLKLNKKIDKEKQTEEKKNEKDKKEAIKNGDTW